MMAIEIVPQRGVQLSLNGFDVVRLEQGDKDLLNDVENRDNLLFSDSSPLKEFFARYLRTTDEAIMFEFRSDDDSHLELLSRSSPMDRKKGIPAETRQKLQAAYIDFQSKASQNGATEEAREFISSLRLADPQECPELYRVVRYRGTQRLIVLWGVVRKDSSQLYPLDAINRIPVYHSRWLLKALAIAGLLLCLLSLLYLLWDKIPFDRFQIALSQTELPTEKNATQQEEPVTSKSLQGNTAERASTSAELPANPMEVNSDKPPFLLVEPQAIEQGGTIDIVPRNKGILHIYNLAGIELLRRNATGVEDRESLRVFTTAVRKVVFTPSNNSFPEEAQNIIIYPSPEIRGDSVRISIPDGLDLSEVKLNWGDGTETPANSTTRKTVHRYAKAGEYLIRIIPSPEHSWAAMSFSVFVNKNKQAQPTDNKAQTNDKSLDNRSNAIKTARNNPEMSVSPAPTVSISSKKEIGASENVVIRNSIEMELVPLVLNSRPFYIGVYEVTQKQFEQVLARNPSVFKGDTRPVENIDWGDAIDFCERLSALPEEKAAGHTYRLPTESEWEFACRAETNAGSSLVNAISQLDSSAWFDENSDQTTHEVGKKKPNVWGLYDMYGNVWECCASNENDDNAVGLLCGGSWKSSREVFRLARRTGKPMRRSNETGFRVAMSPKSIENQFPITNDKGSQGIQGYEEEELFSPTDLPEFREFPAELPFIPDFLK